MNWTKEVRTGWQSELATGGYDTVGTLKFNNGRSIGLRKAEKLVKAYWHRIDRLYFGHAADKGVGVERWVFTEFGEEGNLHFHFMAKSPTKVAKFCAVLNAVWSEFARETAEMRFNHITPVVSAVRCADYITKEARHMREDVTGLACSHRNAAGVRYDTFNPYKQKMRITKYVGLERLAQANEIVAAHILLTR